MCDIYTLLSRLMESQTPAPQTASYLDAFVSLDILISNDIANSAVWFTCSPGALFKDMN